LDEEVPQVYERRVLIASVVATPQTNYPKL
jgi:hypothetical protein